MTTLLEHKSPRSRFARSINVERDSSSAALDGYIPVGRALDALERFVHALERPVEEVALSITGPYGSGKSSLALLLDALLGPKPDAARQSAESLLKDTAPASLERLTSAMRRMGADRQGFIRAVVTAQREPVTKTIVRALDVGLRRYQPAARGRDDHAAALRAVKRLSASIKGGELPDTRTVRGVIAQLSSLAPVLLMIDEFGKNLEAFADSHGESDLFLLQEIAEWSRGDHGMRLAVVTLQHLAFGDYADASSATQRREWAKIQGRFEDIAFVDSPAQARALVAASFEPPTDELSHAQDRWAEAQARRLRELAINDLSSEVLARCWPLHPVSLAALPELCERYGQNERTLFSFLAGSGAHSVATFLADKTWKPGEPLPVVHLDRLYDFFIDSAANLAAISPNASRWVEIDTRIRDAALISDGCRRVLKSVGLLNLVSAGGTIRASRAIVEYSSADGLKGTKSPKDVHARLKELEDAGLITFRDFADEYRVWNGSDFDVRSALDSAREQSRLAAPADVLNKTLPLPPLVAARHSHRTGALRAFSRAWTSSHVTAVDALGTESQADGQVLYVLGSTAPTRAVRLRADAKPTVFVTVDQDAVDRVIDAAHEVAALDDVLSSAEELKRDWVARRELTERRVEAAAELDRAFHAAYGVSSAHWIWTAPGHQRWRKRVMPSASAALSTCCDEWYDKTPEVKNDLVNRHDLTSQAAKARRLLLEGMARHGGDKAVGITGFGPEHTMYLSVLAAHGMHRSDAEGQWFFSEPDSQSSLRPAWLRLLELVEGSQSGRTPISEIYADLSAPPYGVRSGIAPILFATLLLRDSGDVALYEHGTFRAKLTDDVVERLLRNPSNFAIKRFGSRTGARAKVLTRLAEDFNVSTNRRSEDTSVVAVVGHLVSIVNSLPPYSKTSKVLSDRARAVRTAMLEAVEPDELLFVALPKAVGLPIVPARGAYSADALDELSSLVRAAFSELRGTYPSLLNAIGRAIREFVASNVDDYRAVVATRARALEGRILDSRVGRLAAALQADLPEEDAWAEYVAMNVVGTAPETWSDVEFDRFRVAISELGASFRRIYALNAELDARGDAFDAYRHVVTRGDGAEAACVVAIDDATRSVVAPRVHSLVRDLVAVLGLGEAEARAVIHGLVGEMDLAAVPGGVIHEDASSPYLGEVDRAQ